MARAQRGLVIEREPVTLEFGRMFVALDPHGHRMRVYSPREETMTVS